MLCHYLFVFFPTIGMSLMNFYRLISNVVVIIVCITSHMTSTIEQWHLQPSEAVVGHPPAWSVGSC